jgi:hypothetical protein
MMLKAHWNGYEIDSSEAAYSVKVPEEEKMGTLVRALLGSGYFVRSYWLLSEPQTERLRDYVVAQDKVDKHVLDLLDKQIAKAGGPRAATIGVRVIETLLNYVGAHRHQLLQAQTFRYEWEEQKEAMEYYDDYDEGDGGFEAGDFVDEWLYYSEDEIPWDGIVMALGCNLVGVGKLTPQEQRKAYKLVRASYKESGLLDELAGWSFGPPRDYVMEDISRSQALSLRVRLNPDATFSIHGRWRDDGQFIYPYYEYLLELAAKKASAKIEFAIM